MDDPTQPSKRQRSEAPTDSWHQAPLPSGPPSWNHSHPPYPYQHPQHPQHMHAPTSMMNYGGAPLPMAHSHATPWQHHRHHLPVAPPMPMNGYDPRTAQMYYPNHPQQGYFNPAQSQHHHQQHAYAHPPPPGCYVKPLPPVPSTNAENRQAPVVKRSSRYPGTAVRPLRELGSSSKKPNGVPVYPSRPPPPPQPYIPHELYVPSLAPPEPMHRQRDQAPWLYLQDLQHRLRAKQSKTQPKHSLTDKEGLYHQMSQQWLMLDQRLQYDTVVGFEALDSVQWAVFRTCLKDREPLNYGNVGIALRCLKRITAVPSQRNAISNTLIHEELTKLVEWPVASRVLGYENIENILYILVILLEDQPLMDRVKPSEELLLKLSKAAASIWISWSKQERIVQLARRVLVAVNPNGHIHDDDEEELDDNESDADDSGYAEAAPTSHLSTAAHSQDDGQKVAVVPRENVGNEANVDDTSKI